MNGHKNSNFFTLLDLASIKNTYYIGPFDTTYNKCQKTGLKFCMKENIWLSQDFFAIEDT